MSLRDVSLKAKEMGMDNLMVIFEKDGNPNGMDVYLEGELFASLKLTVDFSLPRGRMKKDQLRLRCEVDQLENNISKIFQIPPEYSDESSLNRLWIRTKKSIPVMEFIDSQGQTTGPRIYLRELKIVGEEDESS